MTTSTIKFTKLREVKDPKRANLNDAGIDFYLPKVDYQMVSDLKKKNPHIVRWNEILCYNSEWAAYPKEQREYYIRLIPGVRLLIPSGIRVWIEDKVSALIAFNKSGLSAMSGITVTAQVVDADYTGEVHVGLLNNSDSVYTFMEGDKIGQFVHLPIIQSRLMYETLEEYEKDSKESDRGDGGFGSTDKK